MKVLFVGRLGALGSVLSERFYKEGDVVHIIEPKSKESAYENAKVHNFNIEDEKCSVIFKNNLFDKVIYIDERQSAKDLVSILEYSTLYEAKQFIYVSSYEGKENLQEKLLCEKICKTFYEENSLNIACLRLSTVYGDGQTENNSVFNLIEDLLNSQGNNVYEDEMEYKNYIYIKDAAEAIYLSSKHNINGTYDVCSDEIGNIKELRNKLSQIHNSDNSLIKNKDKNKLINDNKKIVRDNDESINDENEFINDNDKFINNNNKFITDSNFNNKVNFKIKYSLNEGLKNTYKWYYSYLIELEKHNKDLESKKGNEKLRSFIKKSKPYVENITLFLIVVIISKLLENKSTLFLIADIRLVYIMIIGIVYGSKQSILATTLSCALLLGNGLSQGRSLVSMILLSESVVQLLTYILAGVSIGYYSDYKNNKIKEQANKIKEGKEKYEFLQDLYNSTYNEKNILENQVRSSKDSFGKIYGVIKELESLESQYILKSSVDVLEEFLENESIAIYTLNNNFMRLNAKSNNKSFNIDKSMRLDDLKEAKDILLNGEIFINKSFDMELPAMIAPITKGHKVIGLIVVEEIEFSKMSLYHQNLFKVMVNLIESSMIRAYAYEEATTDKRYIDDTILLTSDEFENIVAINEEAKSNNKLEYTLLKIKKTMSLRELSFKLQRCIRETDFAGINQNDDIYVLLSNTSKEESKIVVERMIKHKIKVDVVEEVESCA